MPEDEQQLVERYQKILKEFDNACKDVESHFLSLVKAAIEKGDLNQAREILNRCPDNVTSVFIWEAIRNANLNRAQNVPS